MANIFLSTRIQNIKVECKILKFFELPGEVDYKLESPTFTFSGGEWSLQIYPNGRTKGNSMGFLSLYLRLERSPTALNVNCIIGLKRVDGSVFRSSDSTHLFKKEEGFGFPNFLQRSELVRSKDVVAPDGTLTLFCCARIEQDCDAASFSDDVADVTSQRLAVEKSRCQQSFETLSENFEELFLSGREGNVTIRVKNKEFVVHRLVLTARSPVFRAMFELDMVEKNSGSINIDDCDNDSFENFLLFLYSGKLDVVSSNNALGLYSTADKYDVQQLKEACAECLGREISVDSICDVFHLATLHDETELLNTATQFFIDNANKIVATPKWLSFMAEHHTLANKLLVKLLNKNIQ